MSFFFLFVSTLFTLTYGKCLFFFLSIGLVGWLDGWLKYSIPIEKHLKIIPDLVIVPVTYTNKIDRPFGHQSTMLAREKNIECGMTIDV